MARKNRIVVENGLYHITAKVAHRAFLLKDETLKKWMVWQMYDIADFMGLELYAWSIMDNHVHIFLRVPVVPEAYWTVRTEQPLAAWRSMRPAECRSPRWTPDLSDAPCPITPCGDCPSREAITKALSDGVPVARIPHHEVGFGMSDDEMLQRLTKLYSYNPDKVGNIQEDWEEKRETGLDYLVEEEKARFCRRMYSVTQYMHTFKQRVTEHCNRCCGHEGQLWAGRFYSTLVEETDVAKLLVAAYVEWNAPKAMKDVPHPRDWNWCSYAVACGDSPLSSEEIGAGGAVSARSLMERVRKGYESLFGCVWDEAKARLDAVFADRLPDDFDISMIDKVLAGKLKMRMTQLIKAVSLSRLAFFSRRKDFVKETYKSIGRHFPGQGYKSVDFLASFKWPDSPRIAA